MDSYRMNCRGNTSCKNRSCSMMGNRNTAGETEKRGCTETCQREYPRENRCKDASIQEQLQGLPLAMGYVPTQKFETVFDTQKGFQLGTIFPELCKPFCGKRGGCKR